MSQRYERISHHGDDADSMTDAGHRPLRPGIPSSPPPSFRSHTSTPRRRSISDSDPLVSDADRNLADAFNNPSDSEDDDEDDHRNSLDDRQRVMSGRPSAAPSEDGYSIRSNVPEARSQPFIERLVTRIPIIRPTTSATTRSSHMSGGGSATDGVFANLSAKPERGEELDEKPPTYEQAAADATPPYWENTIFAPSGTASDEVYVDGLPVGSFFSFIWNGMISMSFQLVGFLLTYLLHSTHAARNGSKAGLGITLIQYGFSLKGATSGNNSGDATDPSNPDDPLPNTPSDPNSHDFDPNNPTGAGGFMPSPDDANTPAGLAAMGASDWFAYTLMVVGWFVLIRALSEYLKARRHEALVLQSPGRGLPVPIVESSEEPSHSV